MMGRWSLCAGFVLGDVVLEYMINDVIIIPSD